MNHRKEDFSKEKFKEVMSKLFNREKDLGYFHYGKLSEEDIILAKKVFGNYVIEGLGEEVYRLPGGTLCGKGGWELFNEELKKQAGNI